MRARSFSWLRQTSRAGSFNFEPELKLARLGSFTAVAVSSHEEHKLLALSAFIVFADVWDMACSSKVESRIIIPDGSYCLVKPISLGGHCHSKVTLVISGSIVAPSDPDVWDNKDTHKWLYFHSVDHLTVEGGGTIDGMGQRWWATSCKTDAKNVFLVADMLLR
ncbi:putative endo-polygalacturonase [Helianthus annuus]|nr:putative endo-polygalacturonase [Helianthus annuus]